MTRSRREIHAGGLLLALMLSGCATTPPPTGLLAEAEAALEEARALRAEDYAPVELGFARDRLAAARAAVEERDLALARIQAERAALDAALASAKSRAAAGREDVRRRSEENERLRRELLGEGGRP